ncbi:MAG: hypothetical protein H6867_07970 [Rhodospirillales bacterium]|nr:hypothetical protein [Rhodospirillales bacterium]MCB9995489.1 hypothetical protein [Rhodospirillales bacterium]
MVGFPDQISVSEQNAGAADITAGYSSFDDFVQRNHYQYSALTIREDMPELEQAGRADFDRVQALHVARNLDDLNADSVALNQTINTAVVAVAERDVNDPNQGQMHYVAFMQAGANARTYLFTENITINPDGSITSEMERGKMLMMNDYEEQQAFGRLADKFGSIAQTSAEFRDFARDGDMAVGGTANRGGEYKIEHTGSGVAVSSSAELNDRSGVEIVSAYSRSGEGQVLMKIFRESAEGQMQQAASAEGPSVDSKAKYNAFSQREPGIGTLEP